MLLPADVGASGRLLWSSTSASLVAFIEGGHFEDEKTELEGALIPLDSLGRCRPYSRSSAYNNDQLTPPLS